MAELWPNHPSPGVTSNPTGDPLLEAERLQQPELPEYATAKTRAVSPQLNRSAEKVGRSVGTAVAGVKNLPERVRSRLHIVGREGGSLRDTAAQTVEDWRDEAEHRVLELSEDADRYSRHLQNKFRMRLWQLRRRAFQLRFTAQHRFEVARRDQPLRLIGACAGAAFALGIALRIWRSNSD